MHQPISSFFEGSSHGHQIVSDVRWTLSIVSTGPWQRLALDARLHVAVVLELHVLGKAMDLHPLDRLLLVPVLLERLDAFEVADRELRVAAHAQLDRRDARGPGLVRAGVAVQAVDLVLAGVVRVAEGDRLDGPGCIRIRGGGLGVVGLLGGFRAGRRGGGRLRGNRLRPGQAEDQTHGQAGGTCHCDGPPRRTDRDHALAPPMLSPTRSLVPVIPRPTSGSGGFERAKNRCVRAPMNERERCRNVSDTPPFRTVGSGLLAPTGAPRQPWTTRRSRTTARFATSEFATASPDRAHRGRTNTGWIWPRLAARRMARG